MALTGAASLARAPAKEAKHAVSDNAASDLLIVSMSVYLSLQSAAPAKDYLNCGVVSTFAITAAQSEHAPLLIFCFAEFS